MSSNHTVTMEHNTKNRVKKSRRRKELALSRKGINKNQKKRRKDVVVGVIDRWAE